MKSKQNKVRQFTKWKTYLKKFAVRHAPIYAEDQRIKFKCFLRIGKLRIKCYRMHVSGEARPDYIKFANWLSRRQKMHFQFNRYSKARLKELPLPRSIKPQKHKKMHNYQPATEAVRRANEYWQKMHEESKRIAYRMQFPILTEKNRRKLNEAIQWALDKYFLEAVNYLFFDHIRKQGGHIPKVIILHSAGPYALKLDHDPTTEKPLNYITSVIDCSDPAMDQIFAGRDNEDNVLHYFEKLKRFVDPELRESGCIKN